MELWYVVQVVACQPQCARTKWRENHVEDMSTIRGVLPSPSTPQTTTQNVKDVKTRSSLLPNALLLTLLQTRQEMSTTDRTTREEETHAKAWWCVVGWGRAGGGVVGRRGWWGVEWWGRPNGRRKGGGCGAGERCGVAVWWGRVVVG